MGWTQASPSYPPRDRRRQKMVEDRVLFFSFWLKSYSNMRSLTSRRRVLNTPRSPLHDSYLAWVSHDRGSIATSRH